MGTVSEHGEIPRWAEEFNMGLAVAPQLFLTGNLGDIHLVKPEGGQWSGASAEDILVNILRANGYYLVLAHDTVAGLRVVAVDEGREWLAGVLGKQVLKKDKNERNRYGGLMSGLVPDATLEQDLEDLAKAAMNTASATERERIQREVIPNANPRLTDAQLSQLLFAVSNCAWPCALLIEHASWLVETGPEPQSRDQPFRPKDGPECFRVALKLCKDALDLGQIDNQRGREVYNPIIWMSEQLHDLPAWLTRREGFRHVNVAYPERQDRRAYAEHVLCNSFEDYAQLDSDQRNEFLEDISATTDGLSLRALSAVGNLARDEKIPAAEVVKAVSTYKFGVRDSPWRRAGLADSIKDDGCFKHLSESIFGQDEALKAASLCVNKAVLGFSSLGSESSPNKPRGVLFLAGPTGTGKTELAKRLAEFVFGSPEAFTRFDMSEYSSSHSDTRLIGAPPSYVGYDSGGQLTNAVRDKPFSLLLFDEIEKADPSILDKFLQVLDEGRLTDSKGATVFFSETLIVFTSNLGVTEIGEGGQPEFRVTPADPPERVEEKIREGVENFFTGIARPELYGRLKKGIVVLGFIKEEAAKQIVEKALSSFEKQLATARPGATLRLEPEAKDALLRYASAPDTPQQPSLRRYGGRSIRDMVETLVLDPVVDALVQAGSSPTPTVVCRYLDSFADGKPNLEFTLA